MEKRDISNAIVSELIARRRKARLAVLMSFVLVVAGALMAMHYGRRNLPLMLVGIGIVMSAAFLLKATGERWSDPFVMEGRPKPRGAARTAGKLDILREGAATSEVTADANDQRGHAPDRTR